MVSEHHWGDHRSFVIYALFNFFHFWAVFAILGYFCIFGTFLHFWVVLGEPVSYKIIRGVKLVVGRVIEGVWWGLVFFLDGLGGF